MQEASRFALVSRRRLFALAAMGGAVALVGCGSDEKALGSSGSGSSSSSSSSGGPGSSGSTGSSTPTNPAAGTGGAALPATAQLAINFTFAAGSSGGSGRGGAKNPYIAVWLEDANGALVKTVSVWHLSGNDRWLNELKRWYAVSGGSMTASGATRAAGSYKLAWDGSNDAGARVSAGNYYLCIEGAREHGAYELIREKVTFGSQAFTSTLTPNGELTAASISYTA
ncbi:DUF2271 domain-containing protein [Naumannella sp. ID2617S]|nr:DUF2271 domain-containing protein [Naumannella sp. ID2617S]